MKAYKAYSKEAGPSEGAILVIANTSKEAKKLAWKSEECMNVEGWIDLTVRLLRFDAHVIPLADQAKLQQEQPHVIASPLACEACGRWGAGLDADNCCLNCSANPGDELIDCLTKSRDVT